MTKEKNVDESWKEQAAQEKGKLFSGTDQEKTPKEEKGKILTGIETQGAGTDEASQEPVLDVSEEDAQPMEVNFLNYITSLSFQAMIFLGDIPHPASNKIEKNLDQAKLLIDTLVMLKEKTAGNLSDQEQSLVDNSVYELQLRYVQVVQNNSSESGKGHD